MDAAATGSACYADDLLVRFTRGIQMRANRNNEIKCLWRGCKCGEVPQARARLQVISKIVGTSIFEQWVTLRKDDYWV